MQLKGHLAQGRTVSLSGLRALPPRVWATLSLTEPRTCVAQNRRLSSRRQRDRSPAACVCKERAARSWDSGPLESQAQKKRRMTVHRMNGDLVTYPR